ncbi:MAG: radical SAM protein [Blastocatellia bacterium]
MNIVLIFPPCADPALPYGALPLLGAILKRAGHKDVFLRDLNLEVFDDLLRVDSLVDVRRWLKNVVHESEPRRLDSPAGAHRQDSLAQLLASSDEVIQNIDEARRILKDPGDFYNPSSLLFAKRILAKACSLLSAPYEKINFGKYSYSSASYDTFDEINEAIRQDEDGMLTRYFNAVTVPEILKQQPGLVGFSIPYFSQLIPTFILARLIKDQAPEIHITLGGPVPSWGKHVLASDARFGRWIDSVAIGEADETILELVEALEGKRPSEKVRNFVIYQKNGVLLQEDPTYKVDLNWLPTPDFSMLPLDRYFAPKRIICMVPTRGCYFNRCTFCNYAFIKLAPYRSRAPHLVAEDVQKIKEQTGEDVFCFESDVMAPNYLRTLAQGILDNGVQIKWHAVARFEKGMDESLFDTMHRAGCVRLYMGMESVNQRLLDLMDKGTTRERIEDILHKCHHAGIAVEAGVFGNFPSETPDEAEETYHFVRKHRRELTRCDVGEFRLLRGSPIAKDPAQYGIHIIGNPQKKWYHLQYEETVPKQNQTHAVTAMQKIQAMYPEVALVDVPEDILYTARFGPNAFGKLLDPTKDDWASEFSGSERPQYAEDFAINRAFVANSGAVLFVNLIEKAPAFASSEIPMLFAVDGQSGLVHPLEQVDLKIIELSRGYLTFDQIYTRIVEGPTDLASDIDTHKEYESSVRKLLDLGILTKTHIAS